MSFEKTIIIKGKQYLIKPSFKENKKYDVHHIYSDNLRYYVTSFGDKRYEQYKDKIGYYKDKDHNDKKRRKLYRDRHKNDNIDNPNYAGFWSYHFLW